MPVRPLAAEPSERVAKERQKPLFTELPDSTLPQVESAGRRTGQARNRPARDAGDDQPPDREKAQGLWRGGARGAATPGPVVTRYEMEPATGVKGSQIVNLAKDLARSLRLVSIRVVENIPGKNLMALELPNAKRQTIRLTRGAGLAGLPRGQVAC